MALLDQIYDAGVVGCGGAGFPTHAKLKGRIRQYIINGAECEPVLETDRYLMRTKAEEIVSAAAAVRGETGAERCTLALKEHYEPEIRALETAIRHSGQDIKLHTLPNIYPVGDEQVLVEAVTGRVVPPGGIPLDVGVAVNNVATLLAIHDAMRGVPLAWKYLTVAGEVKHPCVVHVPVGASVSHCISLAGGVGVENPSVILGGPMMGAVFSLGDAGEKPILKTSSGILVVGGNGAPATLERVSARHMLNRARSVCIQCSYCTQLCPRYLLGHPLEPHRIMRKLAASSGDIASALDDKGLHMAALCCECGVCEVYACPMELQPRRMNILLKAEMAKAGIRYSRPEAWPGGPAAEWALRKVPASRIAARTGVGRYIGTVTGLVEGDLPRRIDLPLRQHIGVPAEPVVKPGDTVREGQLVARCPPGKLGANLHTGISGTVTGASGSIVIEGGRAR